MACPDRKPAGYSHLPNRNHWRMLASDKLKVSVGVIYAAFALFIVSCDVAWGAARIPQWMTTDLKEVGISTDSVAVYVKDASSGVVIANHNATTPFKPASITKVLTTFAALDVLGEQYRWRTPVYVTAPAHKGELRGDLIFRDVGDPSLSQAKLSEFSATLFQRGIKVIRGDVILDRSYFASTSLSADGYFAASFKRSFEQLGGKIEGQIRDGKTAARSKLFGSIESDALIDIVRETNKVSNNLMAHQIFLTIGSELTGEPPSPARAAIAVRKWIVDRVPDTAPFVLETGSGLSHNERVTAKGMVSLLDYIRKSQHAAAFLETMPAVGEDGTMRNRLKGDAVAGKSVAKTGTLRDTAAIAGLVLTKSGRTFIFCMIVNSSNVTGGRKVIDRLIAWLHSPDVDA